MLLQEKTEVAKRGQKTNIYQILKKHSIATLSFFLKKKTTEFYGNIQRIEFKCLNTVRPVQGDSLLLTTKFLGVPGTLLIGRETVKPPNSKHLTHYSFILTK